MKTLEALCLALAVSASGTVGEWFPSGGGVYGCSAGAADDAKCREYGFEPETEAYGNCRLKLEEIRAIKQAANVQGGNQGLSLLCKDALARGDQGGAFVHC